jgi:hypothetical protein
VEQMHDYDLLRLIAIIRLSGLEVVSLFREDK